MKTTVALAAFLMFAASTFGQAVQPSQTRQQQETLPPLKPRARAVPIPNWPANKPAPIIPIPTRIQPQSGLVKNGVLRPTPRISSRPCAIYVQDGRDYQFLEGTLPSSVKPGTRTTSKDIAKITHAGGEVKILSHSATRDDVEAARWACR